MQIAQKIKIDTKIHACVKAVLGLSFKSATDKHALKKENPPRIPQRFLDFLCYSWFFTFFHTTVGNHRAKKMCFSMLSHTPNLLWGIA